MIPGDLLSACPHRQFHTLPGLLDSRAALPNSNPNACMPMQGGSLYHFMMVFGNKPMSWKLYFHTCTHHTCMTAYMRLWYRDFLEYFWKRFMICKFGKNSVDRSMELFKPFVSIKHDIIISA